MTMKRKDGNSGKAMRIALSIALAPWLSVTSTPALNQCHVLGSTRFSICAVMKSGTDLALCALRAFYGKDALNKMYSLQHATE